MKPWTNGPWTFYRTCKKVRRLINTDPRCSTFCTCFDSTNIGFTQILLRRSPLAYLFSVFGFRFPQCIGGWYKIYLCEHLMTTWFCAASVISHNGIYFISEHQLALPLKQLRLLKPCLCHYQLRSEIVNLARLKYTCTFSEKAGVSWATFLRSRFGHMFVNLCFFERCSRNRASFH